MIRPERGFNSCRALVEDADAHFDWTLAGRARVAWLVDDQHGWRVVWVVGP